MYERTQDKWYVAISRSYKDDWGDGIIYKAGIVMDEENGIAYEIPYYATRESIIIEKDGRVYMGSNRIYEANIRLMKLRIDKQLIKLKSILDVLDLEICDIESGPEILYSREEIVIFNICATTHMFNGGKLYRSCSWKTEFYRVPELEVHVRKNGNEIDCIACGEKIYFQCVEGNSIDELKTDTITPMYAKKEKILGVISDIEKIRNIICPSEAILM